MSTEKFIDRLQEHINEEGSVILSEDLKNLIFLCENNPNEIEFLKNAILRYFLLFQKSYKISKILDLKNKTNPYCMEHFNLDQLL